MPQPARRGNELGVRLQAAESIIYLIRALFALERRWPPVHDRLVTGLDAPESHGWKHGELQGLILDILRTGNPSLQRRLEDRVEALTRLRLGDRRLGWEDRARQPGGGMSEHLIHPVGGADRRSDEGQQKSLAVRVDEENFPALNLYRSLSFHE